MDDSLKFCPRCCQTKPRTEFFKNRTRKDGLNVYCRLCASDANRIGNTLPEFKCDVCGGSGAVRRQRDKVFYCAKKECQLVRYYRMAEQRWESDGDCLIWQGAAYVSCGSLGTMRVADLISEVEKGYSSRGDKRTNTCGNAKCVNPDHNPPTCGIQHIPYRLPSAPLIRAMKKRASLVHERDKKLYSRMMSYMDTGLKRGDYSVSDVDKICCDILRIHPTAVYGDLFFTIGTEKESA